MAMVNYSNEDTGGKKKTITIPAVNSGVTTVTNQNGTSTGTTARNFSKKYQTSNSNENKNSGGNSGGSSGSSAAATDTATTQSDSGPSQGTYFQVTGYKSKYEDTLDEIMNKIKNYGDFNYEFNGDNLFKSYQDMYTEQAKQAMLNQMGNSAALTGGYGNSYGSVAGQQQYNNTMTGLYDKADTFYDNAYTAWKDKLTDLYNQYDRIETQEDDDYDRFKQEITWLREDKDDEDSSSSSSSGSSGSGGSGKSGSGNDKSGDDDDNNNNNNNNSTGAMTTAKKLTKGFNGTYYWTDATGQKHYIFQEEASRGLNSGIYTL